MANQYFNDTVIQKKFESVLSTKLDLQQFLTVDNELAENSGMIKKVLKYSVTGSVEDLAMGVGNSGYIESTLVETPYEVGTTQGRFAYYDEQALRDDKVVEAGITGLAEKMVNDFSAKAIAEFDKAPKQQSYSSIGFDTIVDAIAQMNLEDEAGLFMLINPGMQAALRKALKDDLKYVEAFVKTGYIGTCCGVPIYISKAVPENTAYIANQKAVTLFIKKGAEAEQYREPNTRQTVQYLRKVALVAFTDERYAVKIAQAVPAADKCAVGAGTVKADPTIVGTCKAGSTVEVFIKPVGADAYKSLGNATVTDDDWTIENGTTNLAAGDKIYAVAKLTGYVDSKSDEFTVAS